MICRTQRGLEIGEVTSECEPDCGPAEDATIVRPMTAQDELLAVRLERNRRAAVDDCRKWLADSGEQAILLDVDQLFDSGTPIFYFLQAPDGNKPELIARLAERFESRVRTGHFAKLLVEGCGPGCGTVACGDSSDPKTADGNGERPAGMGGKNTKRGGCGGGCAVCVVARSGRSQATSPAPVVNASTASSG